MMPRQVIFYKPKMNKGIDISVTYTLYDEFDSRRLMVALRYLGKQKMVGLEAVIVNATGTQLPLPEFCKQIMVKESLSKKNLGIIRNTALKNCSGTYIYTSDSDIVFFDPLFLKKLIPFQNGSNKALKKVDALRLPIEEFDDFYSQIESDMEPTLKFSEYSVSLNNNFPFEVKIIDSYKFTQRLNGKDSMPFVHAGTTFGKRGMFEGIGGYSEEYGVYGWEDSDIQWKLEEKNGMKKIENLKVIHLDHEKSYFDREIFEKNKRIFFKRTRESVDKAIKLDLDNYSKIIKEDYLPTL